MKIFIKLAVNVLALLIVAYLVPGFNIINLWTAVVTAVVFGIVNTIIKPILQILFIPLTIITLGISAFLINVLLLWGVSYAVPGFEIENFLTAVIASILLSLVTWFLHKLAE